MSVASYSGPSLFGFETDNLRRVAAISVHTSPLAALGNKDAGGMNVYVRELSCHTSELGLPVDVFTRRTDPRAPEVVEICDGVNVINIEAGPQRPISKNQLFDHLPEFAENAVRYALRSGSQYDVIHAHYWLSGWTAGLLRERWDAPFIQMFHTTAHMKNMVSPANQQETPQRARIERQLVDLADSVIAANPDECADLVWRQHAPSEKICTIPPGVDVELFKPRNQSEARRATGLDPHARIVLFVGRIDPIKGIDTLLRAARILTESGGQDLQFVFVGGDLTECGEAEGELAEICAAAKDLQIERYCRFVGSQPQDRLPDYYAAADVVAVPSLYESFGLVAVEAMACGKPVVASRVGGLTFTVQHGETGMLVPYGDAQALATALRAVLGNPDLAKKWGEAGLLAAQRFSWQKVANSVVHVYRQLAAGRRTELCCIEEIYA